jgi:type IV pilus assembly protein PilN
MRFEINLASQPFQDVQRFMLRWGLALLVAMAMTGGLVYSSIMAFRSWRVVDRQERELRLKIAAKANERAQVQAFLNRPQNKDTTVRSSFVNQLIARKAFSWTEIFTDLEQIVPGRLHVTNIEPDINEDDQLELHLQVAGTSHDAAVELVKRLEDSPHFREARILAEGLQNQVTANQRNAAPQNDVWRFDISALYIPSFAQNPGKAPEPAEAAEPPAKESPPAREVAKTSAPAKAKAPGSAPKEAGHARH